MITTYYVPLKSLRMRHALRQKGDQILSLTGKGLQHYWRWLLELIRVEIILNRKIFLT